jgi:hypothetical protein
MLGRTSIRLGSRPIIVMRYGFANHRQSHAVSETDRRGDAPSVDRG